MVKNPPANAGDSRDVGSIPGSGISPGEGNGNPRRNYCLENSIGRVAWQATVQRVTKSWTRLIHLGQEVGDDGVRGESSSVSPHR